MLHAGPARGKRVGRDQAGAGVKHPIVKLFFARLRALAAVGRAAFPILSLPPFLAPFAAHTLRIEKRAGEGFVVTEAGDTVGALFGRTIVGLPFADLFRSEDRSRVSAMLGAIAADRIACVFGAEARIRLRVTAIEAMLAPEPADAAQPARTSACLVSIGFPRGFGRRPLPPLSLRSKRFLDLDGLAGEAPRLALGSAKNRR